MHKFNRQSTIPIFLISVFLAAALLIGAPNSWAGNLQLITYYPAPQAAYDRVNLLPQTSLPTSCTTGSIMVDGATGNLMYCHTISGSNRWGPLDSTWTQTDNYIYPSNTIANGSGGGCTPIDFPGYIGLPICSADPSCIPCIPNPDKGINCPDVMLPNWCYCDQCEASPGYDIKFIGIGTSTPSFKLTLNNDGGILAMGAYGSGAALNPLDLSRYGTDNPRFIWHPRKANFLALIDSSGLSDDLNVGSYNTCLGYKNVCLSSYSVVGGAFNRAENLYNVIAGGGSSALTPNLISAPYAVITGGSNNTITAGSDYSVISGVTNTVGGGTHSTIGGGTLHTIGSPTTGIYQTIGGGYNNIISDKASYATISGGRENLINFTPTTTTGDPAKDTSDYSVIGGGITNKISRGAYSTISGGASNTAKGSYVYIGGGGFNNFLADTGDRAGHYSVIAGGDRNNALGDWSVIAGGSLNTTTNNYSTILGGSNNSANGISSLVAGSGIFNTITATGHYSVIAGGYYNKTSGTYSWVGGRKVNLDNTANQTFVWGYSDTSIYIYDINVAAANAFILAPGFKSDLSPTNPKLGINEINPTGILSITLPSGSTKDLLAITSTSVATAGDILIVKNDGKVGIGNNNPQYPLHFGAQANNAYVTVGGAWTTPSSRTLKDNILALEPRQAIATLRELQPVTYNYKINKNEHHVGFIAEDVPDLIAADGRKSVDPMNIAGILTGVLKEQKKDIQHQDEVLTNLEKELQNLKAESRKR